MEWRIPFVAIAIGFVGLVASCIYMENPWEVDQLFYGYPLLWLETSKSLRILLPPVPLKISILWVGFFVDMLLYSSFGFVVSYIVFTLRENMKLLRFLTRSGLAFFVGSFITLLIASPFASYSIIAHIAWISFFFTAVATPAATIIYGYYQLMKKRATRAR